MRKLLYILASASLWWPATAAAQHHHHHKPHRHAIHQAQVAESYAPTAFELAHDRSIAAAYWHTSLEPPILVVPLPYGVAGEAAWKTGTILLNSTGYDWRDFPEELCGVVVHEYGHLVLGPNYFAATDPSDPMHSPDPNNIMYGGGEHGAPFPTYPQRYQQLKSVGCYMGP